MSASGTFIVQKLRPFVTLQGALAAVLVLCRAYEFAATALNHAMPDGTAGLFLAAVFLDFAFVLTYSLIVILPYLAIAYFAKRAAVTLLGIFALLIVLGTLLLDQYFFVTFVPLGADLFGYSWSDILTTVRASGGYGFATIVPVVILSGAAVLFLRYAKKYLPPVTVTIVSTAGVVLFGGAFMFMMPGSALFHSDREYYLATNKVEYFLGQTFAGSFENSLTPSGASLSGYPLLHKESAADVLGPYLALGDEKPNLVFIIVEGLGRSLVGEGAEFGGFTPFLDSLCGVSLYWENFLSSSGRTFGVLPGLMGSLPYGENGFMEMSYKMPSHISLISLLNNAGYSSSYYYGGDISFDHQNVFLERQNIGRVIGAANFGSDFRRSTADERGFSWGYDDGDLFERSFRAIDSDPGHPRLDIYMTLSTHEPFLPPHQQLYEKEFEERLSALPWDEGKKEALKHYRQEFESLLYLDDMLRGFFRTYSQREDYKNTIFFITGDHRMIPIPSDVMIDRFHVPFIIFSPLVRRPVRFSSVSSHLDVAPSVLALLGNRYRIPTPDSVAWLGSGIDTVRAFRNIHSLPLMRNKNELVDYIDGEYYLSVDEVYTIHSNLSAERLDDPRRKDLLLSKLMKFKELNAYVCSNDKLYPSNVQTRELAAVILEDSAFARLKLGGLNSDQLYAHARKLALWKQYDEARLICNHVLRDNPDYHDVRTLLGLTYAWEGRYWDAEPVYREVLRRVPHYPDAVEALADIEIWQAHYEVALGFLSHEEPYNPKNKEFLFRKAKALFFSGRGAESARVFDTLRGIDPGYPEAKEFLAKFARKPY